MQDDRIQEIFNHSLSGIRVRVKIVVRVRFARVKARLIAVRLQEGEGCENRA